MCCQLSVQYKYDISVQAVDKDNSGYITVGELGMLGGGKLNQTKTEALMRKLAGFHWKSSGNCSKRSDCFGQLTNVYLTQIALQLSVVANIIMKYNLFENACTLVCF